MKKIILTLLAAALALSLTACKGSNQSAESTEASSDAAVITDTSTLIAVYADSSLSEPLNTIAKQYKEINPDISISFNFDSPDILTSQIKDGSDCDLLILSDKSAMDQLDINAATEANTDRLDFVDSTSRIDLLEDKIALVSSSENPKSLKSFDDLAACLEARDIRFYMGDSSVPSGSYAKQILSYYKLEENALFAAGVINYASSIRDIELQIADGYADASIFRSSDAVKAYLNIIDTATKGMCDQIIYPAAILKNAKHVSDAKEFLAYLQTDKAMQVFEAKGFSAAE